MAFPLPSIANGLPLIRRTSAKSSLHVTASAASTPNRVPFSATIRRVGKLIMGCTEAVRAPARSATASTLRSSAPLECTTICPCKSLRWVTIHSAVLAIAASGTQSHSTRASIFRRCRLIRELRPRACTRSPSRPAASSAAASDEPQLPNPITATLRRALIASASSMRLRTGWYRNEKKGHDGNQEEERSKEAAATRSYLSQRRRSSLLKSQLRRHHLPCRHTPSAP